jgi:hypothetical protein
MTDEPAESTSAEEEADSTKTTGVVFGENEDDIRARTTWACDAVTTDALSEIFGQQFTGPEIVELFDGQRCTWSGEVMTGTPNPFVVTVRPAVITPDLQFEIDEDLARDGTAPIDGLDGRAVQVCYEALGTDCTQAGPVRWIVGDVAVEIDMSNFTRPVDFTDAEVRDLQAAVASIVDAARPA